MRCTCPETALATITHCAWAAMVVSNIAPAIKISIHFRVLMEPPVASPGPDVRVCGRIGWNGRPGTVMVELPGHSRKWQAREPNTAALFLLLIPRRIVR